MKLSNISRNFNNGNNSIIRMISKLLAKIKKVGITVTTKIIIIDDDFVDKVDHHLFWNKI